MPASPAEAEALGQEFVEAAFGGTTFQVPLDVDSWPLDIIRGCRGVNTDRQIVAQPTMLVTALQLLLGPEQWPKFRRAAPKRRDHAPASQAFAAAVGIPASADSDIVFGAVPRLLGVLDQHPNEVESDLDQFWGIDYRDRWRFDEHGHRRLTLRQIHARLSHLPRTSALAITYNGGKLLQENADIVLMDVWELLFRAHFGKFKPYPARPSSPKERAEREAAEKQAEKDEAAHKDRRAARQRRLHIENARANARAAQQQEQAHAQAQ